MKATEPVVELRNVHFGYGTKKILEDVNFCLRPGQFASLVGPSGAGKTTLLKLVLRLLRPATGEVLHRTKPPLRIAYVPQLETVDWNFPVTAEEVVLMGNTAGAGWWPWPRRSERQRAHAIMEQLEIGELAQRHIRDLSGGQQQRVFLARALMASPDLLVVDEPTAGVDLRSAEMVFHLLAHLNQRGMSILMTTHDLNMAAAHVPWIVCLNGGIVAQGTPEEVFTEPVLAQTYQGDMMVIRHQGMILVQQRPHRPGNRGFYANGDPAAHTGSRLAAENEAVVEINSDGCVIDAFSV